LNDDRSVVKRILDGDSDAFGELIAKHYQTVYNICRGFMGNDEDAMDMSQEVFIRIYNNLNKFRYESSLFTWIYRICANTCLTQLQKMNRIKYCSAEECNEREDNAIRPEEAVELKELVRLVEDELKHMGETTGKIMHMRLFGMNKFKDIAARLGISSSTTTSIFTRSKRDLQKAVNFYKKEADKL